MYRLSGAHSMGRSPFDVIFKNKKEEIFSGQDFVFGLTLVNHVVLNYVKTTILQSLSRFDYACLIFSKAKETALNIYKRYGFITNIFVTYEKRFQNIFCQLCFFYWINRSRFFSS